MKNRNIFHWEFGTEKPGAVSKVSLEMLETQELVSAFRCGRGVISWRRKHEEFYWIEDGWEENNAEGGHASRWGRSKQRRPHFTVWARGSQRSFDHGWVSLVNLTGCQGRFTPEYSLLEKLAVAQYRMGFLWVTWLNVASLEKAEEDGAKAACWQTWPKYNCWGTERY